jgi:c-di-GMP-binding flagellar brake protein YcgR
MSESSVQSTSVERRREKRVQVHLPVEIRGTDRSGKQFDERTTSENLCRGGVAFTLSRELELGALLEINIPLPRASQQGETDFATRGQVRHVYASETGRVFGVAFTGPRFHRMFLSESATDA